MSSTRSQSQLCTVNPISSLRPVFTFRFGLCLRQFIHLLQAESCKYIYIGLGLIGRDGGLSTLCHGCGFACQERVLKTFPGPGYLRSEDGVVRLCHLLVNLYIYIKAFNTKTLIFTDLSRSIPTQLSLFCTSIFYTHKQEYFKRIYQYFSCLHSLQEWSATHNHYLPLPPRINFFSCSSQRRKGINVIYHVTLTAGFQLNYPGLKFKQTEAIGFFPICTTITMVARGG